MYDGLLISPLNVYFQSHETFLILPFNLRPASPEDDVAFPADRIGGLARLPSDGVQLDSCVGSPRGCDMMSLLLVGVAHLFLKDVRDLG